MNHDKFIFLYYTYYIVSLEKPLKRTRNPTTKNKQTNKQTNTQTKQNQIEKDKQK